MSYFNSGTASARQRMAELDLVDQADWCELYNRKDDGTFWRLAVEGKFEQRFLVRIDDLTNWSIFDPALCRRRFMAERLSRQSDDRG
ncbi:hypothetical protein ACIGHN_13255 [Acidovorax sp. NPDC077693]|uniref:hypothetical protein n=1 Tax=unclassified Acidovorax TaxID=2684926 RepID=UPI0037CBF377